MQVAAPVSPYPGQEASLAQVRDLAQAYLAAAYALTGQDTGTPFKSAPVRLLSLQAVELYLNAFLLASGVTAPHIRALQHDLHARAVLAFDHGLVLRQRTRNHLLSLNGAREYLTCRYGPELAGTWSQPNALHATLKEISGKINPIVCAVISKQFAGGSGM